MRRASDVDPKDRSSCGSEITRRTLRGADARKAFIIDTRRYWQEGVHHGRWKDARTIDLECETEEAAGTYQEGFRLIQESIQREAARRMRPLCVIKRLEDLELIFKAQKAAERRRRIDAAAGPALHELA